jgi:hypothetical protein
MLPPDSLPAAPSVRPAVIVIDPPSPVSPAPTETPTEPPAPAVAELVLKEIPPLLPLTPTPVEREIVPDVDPAVAPLFADTIAMLPDEPEAE